MSDFLWGAASAPHQTEGNNISSDWWERENTMKGMAPSGDAIDSYHRYPEDMQLLADAGLNSYRFGIEWARIEPKEGQFSRASIAHYRRMIEHAITLGLTPMVTLHHFTSPAWFSARGGWMAEGAIDFFVRYVRRILPILDGVRWVVTINEPNMLAMIIGMTDLTQSGAVDEWQSPTVEGDVQSVLPIPSPAVGARLVQAHHAVRDLVRETGASVGWSIADQALTAAPGGEAKHAEIQHDIEDLYLLGARGDDFIGVQAYSSQQVDANGLVPHPPSPDNTLVGTAYRPDSLGMAIRHAWEVTDGIPIVVTENGIATADHTRRIAYTTEALRHLFDAKDNGIDVRGYLHWSALDNYEWGHWEPTFGLIAVDRETFVRTPKPSLSWLGQVAQQRRP